MQDQSAFEKRCRQIALACLIVAVCAPVAVAATWLTSGPAAMFQRGAGIALEHQPSAMESILGLALALLPVLLLSVSTLQARACFQAFGSGNWFSDLPPKALAACGRWAVFASLCGLTAPTLLGLALTMDAPQGSRVLTVAIGSGPVLGALFGAIIWSLGILWARAREIAIENEQFV